MTKNDSRAPAAAPAIHLSAADYDLIAELALRLEPKHPLLSQLILREIDRATVAADGNVSAGVVAIGSKVTFLDDRNGTRRTVELVLPGQADIENNRISVVTSMGAGLIGLRTGSRIDWPCPDGRSRSLTILRVQDPARMH